MNDDDMMIEIIKELSRTEENENVTSEKILLWARRVEVQKAQSSMVSKLHESEDADVGATISTDQNACKTKMQ